MSPFFARKRWRALIALLMLFLLLACVVLRPSKEGQVIDGATGDPVPAIAVRRAVSYAFLFSPAGDPPTGYLYNIFKTTDIKGRYRFGPLIGLIPPGGHSVDETISIEETPNYFSSYALSVSRGQWAPVITLVRKVDRIEDCLNNDKCIERNLGMARACYDGSRSGECSRYPAERWASYLLSETNFIPCTGKTDFASIMCITRQCGPPDYAIPTEESCSVLDSELPRNYCNFLVASRSGYYPEDCDRISDAEIPPAWIGRSPYLGRVGINLDEYKRNSGRQTVDFKSLCLYARSTGY